MTAAVCAAAPGHGDEDESAPGPLAGVSFGRVPVEGVINLTHKAERSRARALARGTPATFGPEPRSVPGTFRAPTPPVEPVDPVEEDRLAGRSPQPARSRPKRAPRRADDSDEEPPTYCGGRCDGMGNCVNCVAARIQAAREGRAAARAERADDPDRDEFDVEHERGDL